MNNRKKISLKFPILSLNSSNLQPLLANVNVLPIIETI